MTVVKIIIYLLNNCSKTQIMTKGQNYAIHILVARDLGMQSVSFAEEAEKYITTNKIQPILIGRFAEESKRCVKWVCSFDLVGTALNKVDKYINQLG